MDALIIMTRIPIPGKTKTRLMDIFTGQQCAEIHTCFLKDLFNICNIIKKDIDIYLTFTPEDSFEVIKDITPNNIKVFPQIGDTLGDRMKNAFEYIFDKGYEKVSLIGSDVPDIQPKDIYNSFHILDKSDICLGPTFDGGYYLIGMKTLHTRVFSSNLKWGEKSVLENTLDIANELFLKVGLVTKHRDIDTKEDIIYFKNSIKNNEFKRDVSPINTIEYLKESWSDVCYVKR
ncbi:hypothetical protein CLPU_20c00320 [Gottschalkia purinilytica]|uniref:Glycosyltransferase n=1 Tax=Gottschalkia purinilytica TaxID=1503 RepID=A0A0L0W6Z9_GOTPU|nr:TIGR04282 family arsenosugar biosynthesis glycosyltransferase [Gottschalkia purinilytica]KNF07256.1 hypothetical protein CLPU_20c00320 [Gottschalkia purinilytica]